MKRILISAGGAVLATGLLAAGLAGSAQAASDIASDPLANSVADAKAVADFWGKANGAALKSATAVNYWNDGKDVAKLQSKGGYTPDGKAGLVKPIGEEKKSSSKVKNVNLPRTIGKVFFENAKGELKWCSATSIQGNYKNLVATAGHCVYDTASNAATLRKWVFVPGYYQGKAPWGIYVGKTAYTHYDFDVYEDYDRDYAFVTVYNGIQLGGGKTSQVDKGEFTAYKGEKYVKSKEIGATEYAAGVDKYGENGPFQKKTSDPTVETVGKPSDVKTAKDVEPYLAPTGKDGVKLSSVEVTQGTYKAAPNSLDNNGRFVGPTKRAENVAISQEEYKKLQALKADGKFLGHLEAKKDKNDAEIAWFKSQYFIKKWVKSTTKEIYWVETYFIVEGGIKDLGKLGDNVGGQGFAWNQKTGQKVFVFGYPSAPHPDGHKAYTGVTPKWCYGKTSAKTVGSAKKKIEEHIALKCSMTEGSNGAPWLMKYSNAKRLGYVNGVTSTFNDQDGNKRVDYSSSPYFDGETAAVYNAAKKNWSGSIVK